MNPLPNSIKNQLLSPARLKQYALLATVLLVLWALWLAADLTWRVITPVQINAPVQQSQATQASEREPVSLSRIRALELFGESPLQQPGDGSRAEAPETRLNLRLVGLTSSSDQARAAAIIEQGNTQQTYIVGEQIQRSRATVHEILPDRVILDNEGTYESLFLEGRDGYEPGFSVRTSSAQHGEQTEADAVTEREASPELTRELAQIQDNPEAIVELINISPVRTEDGLIGYQLTPRRHPELFRASGLHSGDIAVSINGYDLTNTASAIELMGELRNMTTATVRVLRNDEYIDIELSVPTQ